MAQSSKGKFLLSVTASPRLCVKNDRRCDKLNFEPGSDDAITVVACSFDPKLGGWHVRVPRLSRAVKCGYPPSITHEPPATF